MIMALEEISRPNNGWRGSRDLWLEAAYEVLISAGVQNVRIVPLAKKLDLSRTSFYWFFKNRNELLSALLQKWRDQNTEGLAERTKQPAATISAAVLNIAHLWIGEGAFDSEFEFAVRSWGLSSRRVLACIQQADADRLALLTEVFLHHGFEKREADIRARTLYQTQIGYISMRLHSQESFDERMTRIVDYAHVFAGQRPTEQEVADFYSHYYKKNNHEVSIRGNSQGLSVIEMNGKQEF